MSSRSSPGTLGRDLITNGWWGQNRPHQGEEEDQAVWQELEQYREKEKSSSSKHHYSLVEEALNDESDIYTEMEAVTKAGDAKA
jgi:hypothetical protein